MPEKLSPYMSYGEKLISLFARLMFSGQSHSLTQLSKMLHCSKQTVLRLVNDIRKSYGVDIEESMQGNKRYYRLKKAEVDTSCHKSYRNGDECSQDVQSLFRAFIRQRAF